MESSFRVARCGKDEDDHPEADKFFQSEKVLLYVLEREKVPNFAYLKGTAGVLYRMALQSRIVIGS